MDINLFGLYYGQRYLVSTTKLWLLVLVSSLSVILPNCAMSNIQKEQKLSFIHYFGVRKLEAFFVFLIAIMTIAFFINMFVAKPSFSEILLGTVVPRIPVGSLEAALGIVGAVIMPHNLYLHSSLVLTRKVDMKNRN